MSGLIEARPPVTALHAEPMNASEIDGHTDRDRIWATIEAVKAEMRAQEPGFWDWEDDE